MPFLALLLLGQMGSGGLAMRPGAFNAPLITSGHLPQCVGDPVCLMQFTVAADGGCAAVAGSGRDYSADMNQGTSPTFAATSFIPSPGGTGRMARTGITDSSACHLPAAAAVDAGLAAALTGDHTVQCAYWVTTSANVIPFGYDHESAPVRGMYLSSTANAQTVWFGSDAGTTQPSAAISPVGQWIVHSAVRSGTSFSSRANGTTTTLTKTLDVAAPTTDNLYLGRYYLANFSIGGPLAYCQMWSNARSAAQLARDECGWWGTCAESRIVTDTRASMGCWDRGDGGVTCLGNNAGRVDSRGLLSYAGESNAVPGSFAAWSVTHNNLSDGGVVADPVVGAVGSCPYPDPTGGAGAVAVSFPAISDLGATPTGRSIIYKTFTSTAAPWIESTWLRACDSADGGTLYTSDGNLAGSQALDAGASWVNGVRAVTFAGTSGTIALGPWLASTYAQPATQPSLCACLWAPVAKLGSVAGPPIPCGASPCASASDVATMPTAGWPTTSGEITLDYMPMNTATGWLIDSTSTATVPGIYIYFTGGNLAAVSKDSGGANQSTSSGLSWTPQQTYRIRFRWGGGNQFLYRDGVLVASTVGGAARRPGSHSTNATVGNASNGAAAANGWVKLIQVSQ